MLEIAERCPVRKTLENPITIRSHLKKPAWPGFSTLMVMKALGLKLRPCAA